ncbi:hypothetical protein B9Z19DRAFT_1088098, partial [Tuber borchii]
TSYLTEFEKGQIVALRKKNISLGEIGELLNHPKIRESKKARHQTLSESHNDVTPYSSFQTVKRVLASVNIKKWRARKRAMKYKDWIKKDFEGVIFSDKSLVEKSKDPKSMWVFTAPKEKLYKDCIHGVTRGTGIRLMVWACI